MRATLSTKGTIVIPVKIRKQGRHYAGEKFDVEEKNGKIILSPVKRRRNEGLVDLLLNCPPGLKLPPRDKDLGRNPPKF
jgi:AbrB family looped-hinge helix DNA binding protein